MFPLYDIPKKDVRRLAQHYSLPTAERAESMGVCFIGERGRFGDFISTSFSVSLMEGTDDQPNILLQLPAVISLLHQGRSLGNMMGCGTILLARVLKYLEWG